MTYTAVCERNDGWWAVHLPQVPGVFTQACKLDQVAAMAQDAIAATLDIPADSIKIKVEPVLDPQAQDALRRLERATHEADEARKAVTAMAINAAEVLVGSGLTVRDAGWIMGVSHQRVDLLVQARVSPTSGTRWVSVSGDGFVDASRRSTRR
jgi:predicted RNase H-like HicB family nuclease